VEKFKGYIMQRSFLLSFLILLTANILQAQNTLSYDFDGDGKQDKMTLLQGENEYMITYSLSSLKKAFTSKKVTTSGQTNRLEMNKNVVVLFSQFMRGENIFKFRYDAKLKQMKLIGFDNNQYGNAVHDGSGSSSYNLSTGLYEANWNHYDGETNQLLSVPKMSKKYPVKNYTLNNFSDAVIDKLYDAGYELLPPYLK
jgi:hypothetical protein